MKISQFVHSLADGYMDVSVLVSCGPSHGGHLHTRLSVGAVTMSLKS